MELKTIEEALKKVVGSLDKGIRLEAAVEEEGEVRLILSKGSHSDRVGLSRELLGEFLQGKREHEVKRAVGKVISKLNLAARKRGRG